MPRIPLKHLAPGTNIGDVVTWNGSLWSSAPAPSGFTASGDLSGTASSQVVQGLQNVPFLNTANAPGLTAVNINEPTTPFVSPTGCVSDGTYLWICDSSTPYVYKVDPSNWYAPVLRINLQAQLDPAPISPPTPNYLFLSGGYLICLASPGLFLIDPLQGVLVGYLELEGSNYACIDTNGNLWASDALGVQHVSVSSILAVFPSAGPIGTPVDLGGNPASSVIIGPDDMVWAGVGENLYMVNPADDTVTSYTLSGAVHEHLFSAVGYIWVTQYGNVNNNNLLRYDPNNFPINAPDEITLEASAEYPSWMVEFNGILYIADNDIGRLYIVDTTGPTYTGFVSNGTEEWLNQITYFPDPSDSIWMGVSEGREGYCSYTIGNPSIADPIVSFSGGRRVRWEEPTVAPLSNVLYVDGGTGAVIERQTGSIAHPFESLSKAINTAAGSIPYPGPTLLVTPGDYSLDNYLYWASPGNPPASVCIRGLSVDKEATLVPGIQVLSGNITLENVYVTGQVRTDSYAYLNNVSQVANISAGFTIAKDTLFQYDVFTNGGLFNNCNFDGNTIYALELSSNSLLTVDTTSNNTFRVRAYPSDAYTEVVVTSGAETSKEVIASELSAALSVIGIDVSLNTAHQIVLRSLTGRIDVDTIANGSTLNIALSITEGTYGPANIRMDSSSYGTLRTFGTYRGTIGLDNWKNFVAFRRLHLIGTGSAWHTLVVIDVPSSDTDMLVIDWTVYAKDGTTESLIHKCHSVAQRLGGVTTIADSLTELITPNAVGVTQIVASGDYIEIQIQQDLVKDWNAKAEVYWTRI